MALLRRTSVPAAVAILWISCYFLIMALLGIGANALINAGLRRIDTGKCGVFNRIMNGLVNAEIVVTGSSRALTHYDP